MWKKYMTITLVLAFLIGVSSCTHENTRYWQPLESDGAGGDGSTVVPPEPPPPPPPPPKDTFSYLKTIELNGKDMKGYFYDGKIDFKYDGDGKLTEVTGNRKFRSPDFIMPKANDITIRQEFSYEDDKLTGTKTYKNGKLLDMADFTYNNEGLLSKKETMTTGTSPTEINFSYADENKKRTGKFKDIDTGDDSQKFKSETLFNVNGWPITNMIFMFSWEYEYENDKVKTIKTGMLGQENNLMTSSVEYNADGRPVKLSIVQDKKKPPPYIAVVGEWKDGNLVKETEKPFNSEEAMKNMPVPVAESGEVAIGDAKAYNIGDEPPVKAEVEIEDIITVVAATKGMGFRTFKYEEHDTAAIMPPFTMMESGILFREVHSLLYMDQPDILFGKFEALW